MKWYDDILTIFMINVKFVFFTTHGYQSAKVKQRTAVSDTVGRISIRQGQTENSCIRHGWDYQMTTYSKKYLQNVYSKKNITKTPIDKSLKI
jgi:hypothetical protein